MQQVTACSKAKQSEWDIQEEVRKAAEEYVEEANNNNVTRMLQETTGPKSHPTADKTTHPPTQMPRMMNFGQFIHFTVIIRVIEISAPFYRQGGPDHC